MKKNNEKQSIRAVNRSSIEVPRMRCGSRDAGAEMREQNMQQYDKPTEGVKVWLQTRQSGLIHRHKVNSSTETENGDNDCLPTILWLVATPEGCLAAAVNELWHRRGSYILA
jgi:hypothetical protein